MVETLLALFVIFLILFGMLHVFYFFAGQLFADYASLRGARSRAVGFSDYLVKRETRINAIGASGRLVSPALNDAGNSKYDVSQFSREKTLIQRFMVGVSWLEYEYWFGSALLNILIHDSDRESRVSASFRDYAFPLAGSGVLKDQYGNLILDRYGNPQKKGFHLFLGKIDLKGAAGLGNHSKIYLED